MTPDAIVDVAVVGGGPAGLSAALVLGRSRRRVVVFDGGHHRNDSSGAVHGFLTRDGIAPGALREIGRHELRHYGTVRVEDVVVDDITHDTSGFLLTTEMGEHVRARRLLLCTGAVDVRPPIAGAEALHGRLVLPCPYCDAWEHRDRPLAVFAHGDERGARYALLIAQWSSDVTFLPSKRGELSPDARELLASRAIAIEARGIERIDERDHALRMTFTDGSTASFDALFYHLGCTTGHELAVRLGVEIDKRGGIAVDEHNATSVAGVYAAGDATRDTLQAIVGAGEGAAAAIAINQSLVDAELSETGR